MSVPVVMNWIISELFTAHGAWLSATWLAAGAVLVWNRPLRLAIYAPIVVAMLPTLVEFGTTEAAPQFQLLPHGISWSAYSSAAVIPLTMCLLGGLLSRKLSPATRDYKQTRVVLDQARHQARVVDTDLANLRSALGRLNDVTVDGQPVDLEITQRHPVPLRVIAPSPQHALKEEAEVLRLRAEISKFRLQDAHASVATAAPEAL